MPIYEYRCTSCGHELEVLQKLSDAPLTECPACHAAALQKKVSAAGFQLKGSGWYATDFRNSGAKAPAKDNGEGAGKDKGSDAKPEAKSGDAAGAASTTDAAKPGASSSSSEAKPTTAADKSAT